MKTSELKNKLEKSIEFLKSELNQVSTGRAKPSLIENVTIAAYGSMMSLKELGSIVLQDPQNLVITPWDKSLIRDIANGIRKSDLNLNPVEDGDRIRVPIPVITEDRRKKLSKTVSIKVEECKQSIRNIRQDIMKFIDKEYTDKAISEDERFSRRGEVEDMVKEFVEKSESIGEIKKKDVLTV